MIFTPILYRKMWNRIFSYIRWIVDRITMSGNTNDNHFGYSEYIYTYEETDNIKFSKISYLA